MAKPLVSDDLWAAIEPLLPPERPKPKGGRPRLADRAALTGIVFVLVSGIPWERLPAEMGCGCGMSCWRRLRDWQAAGVWAALHRLLLERLQAAGQICILCLQGEHIEAPQQRLGTLLHQDMAGMGQQQLGADKA